MTGPEHKVFQPFFTVIHDQVAGRFRMWYGVPNEELSHVRSRLAYMESRDGIQWEGPPRILDIGPIQFGVSIIDDGPSAAKPDQRFKYGWHIDNGLKIATSPDGFAWTPLTPNVVVSHNHDINGIFKDPIRNHYVAILSFYIRGETWTGERRISKQTTSTDLIHWKEPWPVITPDAKDEGETQFYAMDGFLARGKFLVGMVKVLRDDLKADSPPEPPEAYGIGYTTIAWSRDGQAWTREKPAFLDRNPIKGTWDHAHAWIDEQVLVGDEVYLYYSGYKSGHKVNRFRERQIGVLKMKRDRYVAYESTGQGTFQTKVLRLSGKTLFVNADASQGELRMQICDLHGKPLKGYTYADCQPVRSDSVKARIEWKQPRQPLPGEPAILQFSLKNAKVFGFEME